MTATPEPLLERAGLVEFVEHLRSTGQRCAISLDGRQAWFPSPRGILCRLPFECAEPAAPAFVRRLLRQKNVWLVNYLAEPGAPKCIIKTRYTRYSIDSIVPTVRVERLAVWPVSNQNVNKSIKKQRK